jgi:hypothetical protein
VTLVIKKIDERKLREFKAEAIRRGLTLSKALEQAIDFWLKSKDESVLSENEINDVIYNSIESDVKSKAGNYVVIAHGKLAGFFETLNDVSNALKNASPPLKHAVVVKIGVDKPQEVELEWLGGSIQRASA